jgi:hypothetical protein
MDIYVEQLMRIQYYILQAHLCQEKGLARLHYMKAIELLQEHLMNLHNSMSTLESIGEQPNDVFHD